MRIINTKNDDFIFIDDSKVIRLDDFLAIEVWGFYWGTHSYGCKTCKSFIDSFPKTIQNWVVEYGNEYYKLEKNNFGSLSSYYDNCFTTECSIKFEGTRCKFKITPILFTKEELKKHELCEHYEMCNFISKNVNRNSK